MNDVPDIVGEKQAAGGGGSYHSPLPLLKVQHTCDAL